MRVVCFFLFLLSVQWTRAEETFHILGELSFEAEPAPLQAKRGEPLFRVKAAIYDHRNTHLLVETEVNGERSTLEAWSNLNWNHLGGFSGLETSAGDRLYFTLERRDVALYKLRKQLERDPQLSEPVPPAELPKQREAGARFLVVKGESPVITRFLAGMHALYSAEKKQLREAYQSREYQKRKTFDGHAKQRALLEETGAEQ